MAMEVTKLEVCRDVGDGVADGSFNVMLCKYIFVRVVDVVDTAEYTLKQAVAVTPQGDWLVVGWGMEVSTNM